MILLLDILIYYLVTGVIFTMILSMVSEKCMDLLDYLYFILMLPFITIIFIVSLTFGWLYTKAYECYDVIVDFWRK